jgi:hypothetical protein
VSTLEEDQNVAWVGRQFDGWVMLYVAGTEVVLLALAVVCYTGVCVGLLVVHTTEHGERRECFMMVCQMLGLAKAAVLSRSPPF